VVQQRKSSIRASFRGTLLLITIFAWILGFGASNLHPASAEATTTCPEGATCAIYLPYLFKPSVGDLAITGVEITQSVQDSKNSVRLVAGRSTILRIFTKTTGTLQPVSDIDISVTVNRSTTGSSTSPRILSSRVSSSSSRSDFQSTINYPLPAEWLSGEMDLTVKLDPKNQLSEADEDNNTFSHHLVFYSVPPLNIMVVPIEYRNPKDGHTYPAPQKDTISDWIQRTYPVSAINLTWHPRMVFDKDLSEDSNFRALLNRITELKTSEHAPESTVYYGLIPNSDGSKSWFSGGVAGVGWINARAAIGLEYWGQTSKIAAHEIGHNLGMGHTPCNVSGSELSYPYPNGSIGQYGLDVLDGRLYPPTTADVMSYCDPKWISDYTYNKLFTALTGEDKMTTLAASDPGISQSSRKLLVRASIGPEGVLFMPAYVLSGQLSQAPAAGEYQVQVIGQHDEVLLRYPLRALVAEEENIRVTSINTLVPLPDQPAAKVRLLKDGQMLAEQVLQADTDETGFKPTVTASNNGYTVRWTPSNKPVLVRYSADSGKTWTTLGMDLTGGEWKVNGADLPQPGGNFEVLLADQWK